MINDATVNLCLPVGDFNGIRSIDDVDKSHFERIISAISVLNDRSEKFSIVIDVRSHQEFSKGTRSPTTLQLITKSFKGRELEVYELAISGFPNKVIAEKLFISIETVKSHRKSIVQKAGVKKIEQIKDLLLQAHKLIK